MGHRPYPDADRALAQLERRRPQEETTTLSVDTGPLDAAFRSLHGATEAARTRPAARAAALLHEVLRPAATPPGSAGSGTAGPAHPLTLPATGQPVTRAGAEAEAVRAKEAAAGARRCHDCGHAPHAPGTGCHAGVDHGPETGHRCLCLAMPGASQSCPPLLACQGGGLGAADIVHLREGGSLRGADGVTITPDALAEPAGDRQPTGSRHRRLAALHPRLTGRSALTQAIVDEAVKAGHHVHVATRRGIRCHAGAGACGLPPLRPAQPLILARADRTCAAVPSQWNAWTVDGQYLYLRYRSGIGTVDAYDTEDSTRWTRIPDGRIALFDTGDPYDGEMDLPEFCARAGLQLADDAEVSGE